jgi:large subunit ribosomal protein L21
MPLNEVKVRPQDATEVSEFFEKRRCLMYAIIVTGGKQYKVSEGDVIKVEKLDVEAGKKVTFDVIAVNDDTTLKVADEVSGAKVDATVMEQGRDKKVIVYKYKRKTGYHKKNGHRQPFTRVKIEKISL